jgi:hypothetical protein
MLPWQLLVANAATLHSFRDLPLEQACQWSDTSKELLRANQQKGFNLGSGGMPW